MLVNKKHLIPADWKKQIELIETFDIERFSSPQC